jgi:hypothetical protein
MAQGGKRAGSGRKPKPKFTSPLSKPQGGRPSSEDRQWAGRMIESINLKPHAKESREVKRMRRFSEAKDLRIQLDFIKWLYDKRDGKATQPIDHGVVGLNGVTINTNVTMPDPHE